MDDVLTSAQMRAAEQAMIGEGAVTGLELMERAGRGVVEAILDVWPRLRGTGLRAVVLCGPGNNGGDGFVIARLLKEAGWTIDLFLHGDPARLPPDARANHDRWSAMGQVRPLDDPRGGVFGGFGATPPDLVVDAIFGTGLSRALPDDVEQALTDISHWMHRHMIRVPCVAVDIPSGLSSDTGRALGCSLGFDLTVTFHAPKLGHYLADGPALCGSLRIVDIGLPRRGRFEAVPKDIVQLTRPSPAFGRIGGHKYAHGHALILSGGPGRTGAARLAARGALRVGAGLVTLGVPAAAQQEAAAQLTAIMLRRAGTVEEVSDILLDDRVNSVCLGPGLGLARAGQLVRAVLSAPGRDRRVVLDADALTAFEADPASLFAQLTDTAILTPHDGEFARLFPDLAADLRSGTVSKVGAVRRAAERAGCVVLLKGPDTVIAAPDGQARLNASVYDRAAPWLATAGSGDVLAGFITGLAARGVLPLDAAASGAWLHTECARAFGPGLIAEDLPEQVPGVLRALGH